MQCNALCFFTQHKLSLASAHLEPSPHKIPLPSVPEQHLSMEDTQDHFMARGHISDHFGE